ncbi:MAG: DUF1476 domain-containing protein [Alphaproteobacteria bacterium]|nr:DUF1476 domain-containing protein [Alphaproteobacteria bacterium]
MSGFDDREKAYENKYAHEEKLGFDIEAKCSKIFGLWAAAQLGLEDADAKTYAMDVVESNLEEPGFDDVLRKVRADFDDKGLDISDHIMKVELDKALSEAKKILMEQKNS